MKEVMRENVSSLLPVITEFEKPFWDALSEKRLLVQRCMDCGHTQFPASPVCTECLSENVRWEDCSGKAELWSKVALHKAYLEPYGDVPYAVAIAKIEEGCLIEGRFSMENFNNTPIGSKLKMEFQETKDGTVLLEFVPE